MRFGLGPVFACESALNARRWQVYASRAGFVLTLLCGIAIVWFNDQVRVVGAGGGGGTLAQLAKLGEGFYYALAICQISILLLAAPASAAGSICIDRARGTLMHLMVTDLSNNEIVLGKLGSRLAPVFALTACGLPVAALASLLGGVPFEALVTLFAVSLAIGILGVSLATALSVRASRTHDVLIAVYMLEGAWLIALPIWWGLTRNGLMTPPEWFRVANPFDLVFAPYTRPTTFHLGQVAGFVGVSVLLSGGLIALSIARLRSAVVEGVEGRPREGRVRILPRLPEPSLDRNPVLWREWCRNRPTKMARRAWMALMAITWAFAAYGMYGSIREGVGMRGEGGLVYGTLITVAFGFLIVAASSPTVLAEERTRGSLDVLLATPLPTRMIVLAKWRGAYRMVLRLLPIPALTAGFIAMAALDQPMLATPGIRFYSTVLSLTTADRIGCFVCCVGDFLASGAFLVSLGVFLATWITRVGRAVAVSVILYFALGIGWIFVAQWLANRVFNGFVGTDRSVMDILMAVSPLMGPISPLELLTRWKFQPYEYTLNGLGIVIALKFTVAAILLGLTLWTFNGRLGRVSENARARRRPTRKQRLAQKLEPASVLS
jgi:ABC-type transport system involved in multi-copper enzyme maturation permease subunit